MPKAKRNSARVRATSKSRACKECALVKGLFDAEVQYVDKMLVEREANRAMISQLRKEQEADDRSMGAQRERLIRLTEIVSAARDLVSAMDLSPYWNDATDLRGKRWVLVGDLQPSYLAKNLLSHELAALEVDTALPPRKRP